jgi:[ribosomal protein S5]-alanine N-acetyltransferase
LSRIVARTQRLILREFSERDANGMFRLNADPEVIRYTGDPPFADVDEARALIIAYDSYARDGYGRWSVMLRSSGEYMGWCGLAWRADRDEVDIGFRFFRAQWGQGYATEAARASLALGFGRFGLDRIVGRALVDNVASCRVLAKLGMRREQELEIDGLRWAHYAITAEQFLAGQPLD